MKGREKFVKSVCINVSQFFLVSLIINSELVCFFLRKREKSICIHLIILHCGCSRLSISISFCLSLCGPHLFFLKSGWCSHISSSSLRLIRNYFLLLPYRQISVRVWSQWYLFQQIARVQVIYIYNVFSFFFSLFLSAWVRLCSRLDECSFIHSFIFFLSFFAYI